MFLKVITHQGQNSGAWSPMVYLTLYSDPQGSIKDNLGKIKASFYRCGIRYSEM